MEGPLGRREAAAIAKDCVCGECGGNLTNPWGGSYGIDGHIVRCYKDVEHRGVSPRGKPTMRLWNADIEDWEVYDMATQRPVKDEHALALPEDEMGMLARVNEAVRLQRISNIEAAKKDALVKLALLYRLDPLMGEIIPAPFSGSEAGKPYITIDGRRRIDDRAGHKMSMTAPRPMPADMRAMYIDAGWISDGDLVIMITVTDVKSGATIEEIGRVLAEERDSSGNRKHLPVVKWSLEMAANRAEKRARRKLYGPVALPGGMEDLSMYDDDALEGDFRVIRNGEYLPEPGTAPAPPQEPPPRPAPSEPAPVSRDERGRSAPAKGKCEIHDRAWGTMPDGREGHPVSGQEICYRENQPDSQVGEESESTPEETDDTTAEEDLDRAVGPSDSTESESDDQEWDILLQAVDDAGFSQEQVLGSSLTDFVKMGGTVAHARKRFDGMKKE